MSDSSERTRCKREYCVLYQMLRFAVSMICAAFRWYGASEMKKKIRSPLALLWS